MLKQMKKFRKFNKSSVVILILFVTLLLTASYYSPTVQSNNKKKDTVIRDKQLNNIFERNLDIIIESSDLDSDDDGLTDEEELLYNTNPFFNDTDGDRLLDGEEVHSFGTNPILFDTDSDFLCDYDELFEYKTSPTNSDCDYDGLLDGYEIITFKSNPFDPDTDKDYLLDFDEAKVYNTYINVADTDQDGLLDGEEVHIYNTDPKNGDSDGDGLSDFWEIHNNHNPLKKDNWNNLIGYYVVLPSVAVILVIVGIFASLSASKLQIFKSDFDLELEREEDKKKLFEILSSLPEDKQLSLQEVAQRVDCSEFELKNLLRSMFEDDTDGILNSFSDCTFSISNTTNYKNYHCFYCGFIFDPTEDFCPECLEEVVRCKQCNKPLDCDENYTACATYGLIGQKDGITGFMNVDHICENCMLSDKYSLI